MQISRQSHATRIAGQIFPVNIKLICIGLFACLSSVNTSMAQNSSLEFWPETDIWYQLSPSWRLSSFISITKYNESKEQDLNIYVQGDYAWGKTKRTIHKRLVDQNRASQLKAWLVRSGFMEGWSLGEYAGEYKEDLLFAEIHKRIPLRGGVLLSQRFRVESRWLGQGQTYSGRYRYRIMIEKEYHAGPSSIVPYVNAELYWDSRYSGALISMMCIIVRQICMP